jgi:hypothetical protein
MSAKKRTGERLSFFALPAEDATGEEQRSIAGGEARDGTGELSGAGILR